MKSEEKPQALPLYIWLTSLQLAAGSLIALPLKKEGLTQT